MIKIPLVGYGGRSKIEVYHPESHVIDMGSIVERSSISFVFSMRNIGDRTGFVRYLVNNNNKFIKTLLFQK